MKVSNCTTPCVSIVIPTKNGGELFRKQIDLLQRQELWQQAELLVVDSGSTDNTLDIARAAGAKVYEIEPKEFNHGATRDYGIGQASAEYVVLIVQDALPYACDLLRNLLKPFADSDVAGVYARQLPQPDADLLTKRNLKGWLTGRDKPEVRKMQSLEWYESLHPVEKYLFCNFDNVCSAIKKNVWEKIKFGEISFGEDIDWAERVLKSGLKIVYESSAVVVHSHDRPLSYEYKRTYICHRKLYEQFGFCAVPSLSVALRSWAYNTIKDTLYVGRQYAQIKVKIRLWLKAPVLNALSEIAQYRAVKHVISGVKNHISGI